MSKKTVLWDENYRMLYESFWKHKIGLEIVLERSQLKIYRCGKTAIV